MRKLGLWTRLWQRFMCLWKKHGPNTFIEISGPPVRQVIRCARCGAKLLEVE
jgi:hypothetical protein